AVLADADHADNATAIRQPSTSRQELASDQARSSRLEPPEVQLQSPGSDTNQERSNRSDEVSVGSGSASHPGN
ncbi:MAG: hypothetical protein AAF958_09570, partial [Planctomycetota bacterium]